ncbi:MAG: hypothetical protein ACOY5Y_08750 [Pseudomonadota bacterium]
MRIPALVLMLSLPAGAALADPAQEARSATAACLAAVIDGAPVEDIDGQDVVIRRGAEPVSCTVRVDAGQPVVIREEVLGAIKRRAEVFSLAKTSWSAGEAASRETFCNLPGRRALAVVVTTARPEQLPVLTATVFETAERDERCDRDLGVQTVAAVEPPAEPAQTAAAPAPEEIPAPAAKPKKKQSWLRKIPGLGRED